MTEDAGRERLYAEYDRRRVEYMAAEQEARKLDSDLVVLQTMKARAESALADASARLAAADRRRQDLRRDLPRLGQAMEQAKRSYDARPQRSRDARPQYGCKACGTTFTSWAAVHAHAETPEHRRRTGGRY